MKKNTLRIICVVLAVMMIIAIAACGTDDPTPVDDPPPIDEVVTPPNGDEENGEEYEELHVEEETGIFIHPALLSAMERFPAYVTNDAPILPRGTGMENVLRVAVEASSGFPGLFLRTHVNESHDSSIMALQESDFVSVNELNMLTQNGIASFELDRANHRVILEMQHDVYWHDGTPLTMDDLVFAYEVIVHPEYDGPRFVDAHFWNIMEGVEEFRSGEADYISGLRLSNNNRRLEIQFTEEPPMSILWAGGLWLNPSPRHHVQPAIDEVGMVDLPGHPRARDEALGFGPFIIDTVVPGESVFLVPNDNYWQGAPLVDGVLIEIIPLEHGATAMLAGEYDILTTFPAVDLAQFTLTNPDNYNLYSWTASSFNVLNFALGVFETDEDDNIFVVPRDDGHPITNIYIRKALAAAFDRQTLADVMGQGAWIPAPSVLHPFNAGPYIDITLPGWQFSLDEANRILDEAGFTERDEEGFRLYLDGSPMTFIYAGHDNRLNQNKMPLNIQNWRDIGLRVEMFEDDFIDWNFFLSWVTVANEEPFPFHIFQMGWAMGMNPAPHGLWAHNAIFNMPRYDSPVWREILDDINSDRAWDPEFLADVYSRWEVAFYEAYAAIPIQWSLDFVAVNNRVANLSRVRMDPQPGVPGNWMTTTWATHLVALTAPVPYRSN